MQKFKNLILILNLLLLFSNSFTAQKLKKCPTGKILTKENQCVEVKNFHCPSGTFLSVDGTKCINKQNLKRVLANVPICPTGTRLVESVGYCTGTAIEDGCPVQDNIFGHRISYDTCVYKPLCPLGTSMHDKRGNKISPETSANIYAVCQFDIGVCKCLP